MSLGEAFPEPVPIVSVIDEPGLAEFLVFIRTFVVVIFVPVTCYDVAPITVGIG